MVTEVTSEGWFSRIGNSIKGILFGLVLFIGSFILLGWNEKNAIDTYKALNEVRAHLVTVPSASIETANDGKPVHTMGEAVTEAILADPQFGVSANAIKLERNVRFYQWVEDVDTKTKKKTGGGTETIKEYSYSKKWVSSPISSGGFKESNGHENTVKFQVDDWSAMADKVNLGSFTLGVDLIRKMNFTETYSPSEGTPPEGGSIMGNVMYVGDSPTSPQIGDVEISFKIVPQDTVSVVAKQENGDLVPYTAKTGKRVFRVTRGEHTLDSMMDAAESEAKLMTWILRLVGFILMFSGLTTMLKPLQVLADVLPFLGNLVGGGIGLICGLIAAALTTLTIAISWVVVRPMVGIPLLVVSVGLAVAFFLKARKPKEAIAGVPPPMDSAPPPPPPPPGA